MKAIQHDAQSLRHAAIRRYLDTRSRIDARYKRRALQTILLIFAAITIFSAVFLIRFHVG